MGGDTRTTSNPLRTSLNTQNCVYLLRCQRCGKGYVGETGGTLRARVYQHLYNISNSLTVHTTLVRHFRQHGSEHLRATVLEYKPSWGSPRRKRREHYWINFLGTKEPRGLNQRNHHNPTPTQRASS